MSDVYAPIDTFLKTLKGKYKIPILIYLKYAPKRYHRIRSKFQPASERMLIKHLRELEAAGILLKKVRGTKPPLQVEYRLSEYGYSLCEVIKSMWDWGKGHALRSPGERQK